ncbi:hypothetical protein ACUXZZ_45570 (plasmid) [Streptomyces graminifolii]|uniref:hypothetical protein n=1 Tax=Streptomyces graminifolii TaxID=1266771 RepID=UPI0040598F45
MPTSKSPRDAEPTPQPEKAAAPAETPPVGPVEPVAEAVVEPEAAEDAAPVGPPPGVYEYRHFADCTYPHVPLSCRAATESTDATVYDWPFGPPDDGRWAPTTKTPNQVADNAAPLVSEE